MPIFSHSPLEAVRKAQYAGSWYAADPQMLRGQLTEYLQSARKSREGGNPTNDAAPAQDERVLAIIAPHAGYMFSGSTAAYGYETATALKPKRIFILGPSHHAALHGIALPAAETFETPLGNLSVDTQLISHLKSYPLFSVRPDIHKIEHSLEMQLPWVKQTFGDVEIVPLIVGTLQDESEIRALAEILKSYVTRDDLIVVSSDFTHFGPRYGYTPFHDHIRQKVEQLDREAFQCLSQCQLSEFLDFHARTQDTICGFFPCAVLCAMLPAGAQGALLKYSTSQDTAAEDKDNSVSYLAIAFRGKSWPEAPAVTHAGSDPIALTDAEKRSLVKLARETLELYVHKREVLNPTKEASIQLTPALRQCRGAFVTLYTKAAGNAGGRLIHSDKELRGCIGNIWPVRPLYEAVVENAVAACCRDPRFGPVAPDELHSIELEISVLTAPRRIDSYKDIVLGTDGIILSKHDRQAVFLPIVPLEFGWDLKETLSQLSLKAGLRDRDWENGARFEVFRSLSIEEDH